MGKNAIYGWIGLAVLFVILWQANKRKEESAGAYGDYMRSRRRSRTKVNVAMGSRKPKFPCFCNGHFLGWMPHGDCAEKCAPDAKSISNVQTAMGRTRVVRNR